MAGISDLTGISNGLRRIVETKLWRIQEYSQLLARLAAECASEVLLNSEDAAEQLQRVVDECRRQWAEAQEIADMLK